LHGRGRRGWEIERDWERERQRKRDKERLPGARW